MSLPKPTLDVSVLILNPDGSTPGLKNTLGSIRTHGYDRTSVCMVGKHVDAGTVKELRKLGATYKGKSTLTSLINMGMKKLESEWVLVMYAGTRIKRTTENTLALFATKPTDILFPLVDSKCWFYNASSNGMLFHRETFAAIGDLPDCDAGADGLNSFEMAKLIWSNKALNHGCQFKAVMGLRIV